MTITRATSEITPMACCALCEHTAPCNPFAHKSILVLKQWHATRSGTVVKLLLIRYILWHAQTAGVPTKKCGCQERGPHTYTVTPRCVRATTVFVQKQDVLHILRVCLWRQSPNMHSACAFRHLWPARLHHIFPHYLINGTIFGKKKKGPWIQKMCFDFLYNFCQKHFSS